MFGKENDRDLTKVTVEEVSANVDKWSKDTFGDGFVFRKMQREAVITTIMSWFSGNKAVICSAPTGSGKSITAMVVAGVLSDYYDLHGYILISDLSLIDQYERDVNMYCPEWAVIKGQANYTCSLNGMPFPAGNCHMDGYNSSDDIQANYPECAPYCEYLVRRLKAIGSKVLVCTYSFWLLVRNADRDDYQSPYMKRYFTIADEAHKLVDIVQSHFSPRVSENDKKRASALADLISSNGGGDYYMYASTISSNIDEMYRTEDKEKLYLLIKSQLKCIKALDDACKRNNPLKQSDSQKGKKSKQNSIYLSDMRWASDSVKSLESYLNTIDGMGHECLIPTVVPYKSVTFNSLDDSYLLKAKYIARSENMMFMSATLGNLDMYAKSICMDKYVPIEIPSTFDYSKSPIYYVGDYRMSYKEKENSMPYLIGMIKNILMMYPDKRGIIQTGSYDLMNRISSELKTVFGDRILSYDNSASKHEQLDNYKYGVNTVLVGPTLVEGISLDDDLARFLIIAKMPYAQLTDRYTQEKMNYDPLWYQVQTAKKVLQGIGRGVRNEEDWCVSFVLDGCFENVLNGAGFMFPQEFVNRIQRIPASSILNLNSK